MAAQAIPGTKTALETNVYLRAEIYIKCFKTKMVNLTTEEQILFLISRCNPGPQSIDHISHLIASGEVTIDYSRLIQMASIHGVAPIIYTHLKKFDSVPDELIRKLKNIYLEATSFNIKKGHETLIIVNALKSNNIEAIPFKGAIASELIFGDPALYYGTDIDILVKLSDLQRSKDILIKLGYQYNQESEADLLSSHYHFVFIKDQHVVELHWNLVKRYFKLSPDFWWQNTSSIKYMNQSILCLDPGKYLLYLIFRLHSHMFYPLKFFVIVSEVCNTYYSAINWNHLLQCAKDIRMKKLIHFSLRFLKDYFGTTIDKNIVKNNVLGYNVFVQSILNMLFRDVRRPYLRKILYLFLLDSRSYILLSLLKRIFPGKSELRLRYGIPESSKLVYIYYILNPVLLPILLLKKKRL